MKISDEIRQWCDICCGDYIDKDDCDELRGLADRIDAEMVELPKDMDGVPIHVGDTVYLDDVRKAEVKSIRLDVDSTTITCWIVENSSLTWRAPESFSHAYPDSWERIADDLEEWCDGADTDTTFDVPREPAERIRKLAKEGE